MAVKAKTAPMRARYGVDLSAPKTVHADTDLNPGPDGEEGAVVMAVIALDDVVPDAVAGAAVEGVLDVAAGIYGLALLPFRRFSVDVWFPFRYRLVSCGALSRLLLVASFGGGGLCLVNGESAAGTIADAAVDEAAIATEKQILATACSAGE